MTENEIARKLWNWGILTIIAGAATVIAAALYPVFAAESIPERPPIACEKRHTLLLSVDYEDALRDFFAGMAYSQTSVTTKRAYDLADKLLAERARRMTR